MIITQSSVHMSAEHQKEESRQITTSSGLSIEEAKAKAFHAELDLSAMSLWEEGGRPLMVASPFENQTEQPDPAETRRKLFDGLMDALFRRAGLSRGESEPDNPLNSTLQIGKEGLSTGQGVAPGSTGSFFDRPEFANFELPTRTVKVNVEMTETIEEYESSCFHACGVIKTADGKEINMEMNVSMERSYKATRSYSETMEYTFTDPLVLHFDGIETELTEETYDFDLNLDGEEDKLRFIDGVSAFLALDRNEDGVINNGSELFGAKSGNGFADLAQYDEDGNGYIDEADAIFSELKLWSKATDGGDILESLADRGVGAIYLGASETPFDIKDSNNEMQAQVRASGFFLKENGEAGTVQQIDMVG